jgi:multidrug efflux pump subunit AcrA (membrane-fusion protein)
MNTTMSLIALVCTPCVFGHRLSGFTAVLLSLCILFGVSGCRKAADGAEDKKRAAPPVPVRTARAEVRTLRPSFMVIGTVLADPERQATLTAATSGLVDRLAVPEGTKVRKGDLIVQLDERKARTDLNRAEAAFARLIAKPRPEELTQARALVNKMQAAHALAQARLKKTQELRARNPELVPEVQLLEDQRNEQSARAEMETAQAQLQLLEKGPREEQRREAQVEVEAAQLQLDFCRVTAPFAGEVVELKARVGQRADVGTPLATLLDTSEVLVQARVPGNRLGVLVQAMQGGAAPVALVRCPSFPGLVLPSRAGWLSQQTEGTTSDVPIKLRVANDKGCLRLGMTIQVELLGTEVEGLAIPEIAFTVNEEGKHVVTVIRDGKAVPTEIELATEGGTEVKAGGWVRVVKGLAPGDQVAVENGYALPEGTPVTILPPKEGTK